MANPTGCKPPADSPRKPQYGEPVDMLEGEVHPWDRRAKEPHTAYVRFQTFLLLGIKRSLRAAYIKLSVEEAVAKGRDKAEAEARLNKVKAAPHKWYILAREWEWVERARLYDDWTIREERRRYEESVRETRDRHRQQAKILQDKGIRKLLQVNPDQLSPAEASRFLQDGVKMELASLNLAEMITEVRGERDELPAAGSDGGVDWSLATDEEVEAMLRIHDAIKKRAREAPGSAGG